MRGVPGDPPTCEGGSLYPWNQPDSDEKTGTDCVYWDWITSKQPMCCITHDRPECEDGDVCDWCVWREEDDEQD
jgi:hypothetical protein